MEDKQKENNLEQQVQNDVQLAVETKDNAVEQINQYLIQDGDTILVYTSDDQMTQVTIKKDSDFQNALGFFPHNSFIDKPYGSKVFPKGKGNGYIYLMRMTPSLVTDSLSHHTQILYQADISMVLQKLNIQPGSRVVESGTGSGSLSQCILATLINSGHLYTFEFNEDRVKFAIELFQKLGYNQNLFTVEHRDVMNLGFGDLKNVDSVFLDLPRPYDVIGHSKAVLKNGGYISCFSPCIEQVQKNCEQLRSHGFIQVETVELLNRHYSLVNKQLKKVFEINTVNVKRTHEESQQKDDNLDFFNRTIYSTTGQLQQKGHTAYMTFAILP